MAVNRFRKLLATAVCVAGLSLSATCLADVKSGLSQFNQGDYPAALATLKPLAMHGDVSAQYAMGLASYSGLGMERNLPEAMKWFKLAAGQGLAQAEYCVARMYAHGEGVPANLTIAFDGYRRSASKGYGPAYYNLGVMYANGDGVFGDLTVSLAYFMVAADLGVPEAPSKRDELKQVLGPTTSARAREKANAFKAAIKRGIAPPLPVIEGAAKPAPGPADSERTDVQIRK